MRSRKLLYAESDGQVYLVEGPDGTLTFPDLEAEHPFEFEVRHRTRIGQDVVHFARPALERHPEHWTFKDRVPTLPGVDPVVRRAVNASLTRCVVGVVIVRDDDHVLMVKSNRGFTTGMWNIPGGFIEYGEHPEKAAHREIHEEVGLELDLGDLLGVYMERFESPYFMYGFMYAARPKGTELQLDPDEIADARWMTPQDAIRSTRNPFAVAAFRRRFGLDSRGGS